MFRRITRIHARALAAAAAVAIGLPLLSSGPAAAHWYGWDSVVSNKIDYVDSTDYDDVRNWARDRWNAVGDVDIGLDTGWTNSDLIFHDVVAVARTIKYGGDRPQLVFNYRSRETLIWDNPRWQERHGYGTSYPSPADDGLLAVAL